MPPDKVGIVPSILARKAFSFVFRAVVSPQLFINLELDGHYMIGMANRKLSYQENHRTPGAWNWIQGGHRGIPEQLGLNITSDEKVMVSYHSPILIIDVYVSGIDCLCR
jgi:hypothetical protein